MAWAIGVGLLAASVAVGTVGVIQSHQSAQQQAQNAEDQAKMQQQQMEYNKRMEEREAAALEAETAENVRRQRLEAARLRSAQVAMLGKSGAALASGSPLAVLGATAAEEELKVQDTHYSGARGYAAHQAQATSYGYGAAIAGQGVRAAKASSPTGGQLAIGIAGNVLGTVGKAGSYMSAGNAIYSTGKVAYNSVNNWLAK